METWAGFSVRGEEIVTMWYHGRISVSKIFWHLGGAYIYLELDDASSHES